MRGDERLPQLGQLDNVFARNIQIASFCNKIHFVVQKHVKNPPPPFAHVAKVRYSRHGDIVVVTMGTEGKPRLLDPDWLSQNYAYHRRALCGTTVELVAFGSRGSEYCIKSVSLVT